ncbi:MAG: HAD hydrolase-like protein [Verrucomicrobia bacterium]|nr:HAD hydrolase-like protein [Verrucomicrobiota bacterium]
MSQFQLVVFDMAGTTVADQGEVKGIFLQAARNTGLPMTPEQLQPLRGLSKRVVFRQLWGHELGPDVADLSARVESSYAEFRRLLENHYETQTLDPTEGCLECFDWLRSEGIAIGLTTGFYRKVTDIILSRLGWNQGLDERHVGTSKTLIQASVTSDEVAEGRPAPHMIQRTMEMLGVQNAQQVVKIGDTPPDFQAGRNAGCGMTLAVTNGSHTAEQLQEQPHDELLSSLSELKDCLQSHR